MQTKQRSSYIDIAKGLLILVVIFHHIMFAAKEMHVDNIFTLNLHLLPLYASWFMPAFFFITGYCSNFDKELEVFLYKNIRTLLWPALTSFLITSIYGIILFNDTSTFIEACKTIPVRGFNWFLMAMFISKLLYWFINRCVKSLKRLGILILFISFMAILCNDINFLGENWFHYRHALYLSLFLYLGQVAKKKDLLQKKYLLISMPMFIIPVLICMKISGVTPGIAGLWINFNISQVPLHLYLALTGTLTILCVSMLISKCKLLEQIGKDSLIYYIFHIDVTRTIIPLVCRYLIVPVGVISVAATDIITILLVSAICGGIAFVLNNSVLKKVIRV